MANENQQKYTMFISGLSSTNVPDKSGQLKNVQESEVVMVFDSIENYSISHRNEKTGYAIETRSNITDHVFSPDSKFSFVGRITSTPMFVRDRVEWDKTTSQLAPKLTQRIKLAYETLLKARDSRAGITISCEEFTLIDYVITSLEMVKDGPIELAAFNITLEEQRFATIGTTVLATGVNKGVKKSSVAGGKANQSQGSTQDATGNKPKREVVETLNMNSKTTDLFRSRTAEGRTEFSQTIPEGQQTEKFKLGLDKN